MKTTRHATYNLNYHLVWFAEEYRNSVLVNEVADRVRTILHEIADDKGLEMLDLTVQPDHVHLFVSSPPKHAPSLLANWFKGISSRSTTTATPTTTAKNRMGEATTQGQQGTYRARDGQELHPASRGGGRAGERTSGKIPRDAIPTEALHDAFDAGCTTQTEANDVVVNYKLSGYAKECAQNCVPQLTTTYSAGELHDARPSVYGTKGYDSTTSRERYRWYVKIPHHGDYHLWMPAQPRSRTTGLVGSVRETPRWASRLFERDGTA